MGDIYRATDTALGRTVAAKVLSDRYAGDDAIVTRFEREARTAASLSGAPNVVTITTSASGTRGRTWSCSTSPEGHSPTGSRPATFLHLRSRSGGSSRPRVASMPHTLPGS